MFKVVRRILMSILFLGCCSVLTAGVAGAAPEGGPVACQWDGSTISTYNSDKVPGGPETTTGYQIAALCTPGTGPVQP